MDLRETLVHILPTVNATLNGLSGLLLGAGYILIKRGGRGSYAAHRKVMMTAFGVSGIFLICYLVRVALSGIHRFPGEGFWRTAYLSLLASHVVLAAVVPVMAIRAVQLGIRKRFDAHRALVRFLFPIWMYVSITGVVVYLMLYHWPK